MQDADGLGNYSILLLDWWRLIKCLHSFSSFYPQESRALKPTRLLSERGTERTARRQNEKRGLRAELWGSTERRQPLERRKPLVSCPQTVSGRITRVLGGWSSPGSKRCTFLLLLLFSWYLVLVLYLPAAAFVWQRSPLLGFGLSQAHRVMKSKRCCRRRCCQERGLSCAARRSRSQPYALARGHHVGAQRPPRIVLIRFLEINPMAGKSRSISLGMVMRFTPRELFLLATSPGTESLRVSEVPPSGRWESGELAPREGRLQFLPIVV